MRALRHTAVLLLLLAAEAAWGQRFYYLTAEDLRIDSVAPTVTKAVPLSGAWQDSVYTAEILYPDFIDMPAADVAQYNKVSGATLPPVLPAVEQSLVVTRREASLLLTITPIAFREGRYRFLAAFMLKVGGRAIKHAQTPSSSRVLDSTPPKMRVLDSTPPYAAHSVLASGRWAKIRVAESGFAELTDAVCRRAGFTSASRVHVYGYGGNLVPETLTPDYLASHDDLRPVATAIVGGRRLFYARGPVSWDAADGRQRTRNPYSTHGYYLITEGGEPQDTVPVATLLDAWREDPGRFYSLHETDDYAWYAAGRNLVESQTTAAGRSRDITLAAPPYCDASRGGRLTVAVTTATASTFSIAMNGVRLGGGATRLAEYDHAGAATLSFDLDSLRTENIVTVTCESGGPLRLDFAQLFTPSADGEPDLATLAVPAAEYVCNITPQDHHADTAVDLTIIIPTSQSLRPEAERLAEHHRTHDGLTVRIVPADELYNEYSSGTPDVSAYRRYMKQLYDRAESPATLPKHLLLFGDCLFDNRLLTADGRARRADDMLLCYESDNSVSGLESYVSDDFIAMLDDGEALATGGAFTGTPDIGVGRFPVATPAEARIMVDKTIAYARNANAGPWQNTLLFMGDDGNGNSHMEAADALAETVLATRPGYNVRKAMWDAYRRETSATGNRFPDVETMIKSQQQAGALVMDYSGHGAAYSISHEAVLTLDDFRAFTNANLPLWVTASCDIAPFDGLTATIGETAVLSPTGGAVAFFGTTRTVYSNYNRHINDVFVSELLTTREGEAVALGEASRRAKTRLVTEGLDRTRNKLQYALLGDPALRLNVPLLSIVVDSINGTAATAPQPVAVKANSRVSLAGHIADSSGKALDDFNGRLDITVRDSRETVRCLNWAGEADEAFAFHDRPATLFAGQDSVRGGRFAVEFVMPRDINYSSEPGLATLFASDMTGGSRVRTAHGETRAFTLGGCETVFNDSIGPAIYCYLNSPAFVNGASVNERPVFVAEVSDRDGLNTSTAGIGHGMTLTVDGEPGMTYDLTPAFALDFGSCTRGSVTCALPTLAAGLHTLAFRCFDVLNNPSVARLTFRVVPGLSPSVAEVQATRNPARDGTTFIVAHDRPASAAVSVEVYDMSGRLLHRLESHTVGAASATIAWDLTTASGHRLAPGVYLYRATVGDGTSRRSSKAKKLIVN